MPPDGAAGPAGSLLERLTERVHRQGPLPYAAFVEAALYDPEHGFYTGGRGAGRRRDFLTSPEVGPLFGAVLARAIDRWWDRLGRPDPFVVVECGAGPGTLARDVLAAGPACAPALRYLLVERSPALRDGQATKLALELPQFVLGPSTVGEDEDGSPVAELGRGPLAASLAELPADPVVGLVLANELLDNLPFSVLQRSPDGWDEIRVGVDADRPGRLVEVAVPAAGELVAAANHWAPGAPASGRIPVQTAARSWLRAALDTVDRGAVIAIDYAATTPEMAARPWAEWLRTYRAHGRGGHPLDDPGSQDVTCEVAVDQLAAVAPPSADTDQAGWLAAHGIEELTAAARSAWQARAAVGDLAALRARSRVGEAAALTDPAGLGAFRVLEWHRGR